MEKPNKREKYERADQRDRHGKQRNQRGAPALQEDVDHQDHQREGDQKRYDDFLHAFGDRARRIQRDDEIQVFREALLHLGHQLIDAGGSIDRVRARQLVGGNDGARLSVETACDAIVLRTQLDSSDIADPDDPAVGRFAHHDLSEFFRRHKAALRENRVGKFLAFGRRLAARLPGRVHGVLRLNGADDFRDGDAELCQRVGFYPQSHGVLAGAEYLNVADAWRTQ